LATKFSLQLFPFIANRNKLESGNIQPAKLRPLSRFPKHIQNLIEASNLLSQNCEANSEASKGYLAKLGFWFKIKARVKILPQAYI